MYKHILIPTDGSELSLKAIHDGVDFAKEINAQVTFVSAMPPFHLIAGDPLVVTDTPESYDRDSRRIFDSRFKQATEYAAAKDVVADTEPLYAERPYEAIIDAAARKRCDLIFMASHGRTGLKGFFLGSETHKVLTHSNIPVQVCR
jgi:Universal stress protein UspA and related nucleotide-binding proteins